ncbi:helix-turn-helix domain-containing protein [Azospirillum argentinense]|nr:helix-turn-helix transcriptional regulator [Azospirillum argentinense]
MHTDVTSAQFRMARAALEWTVRDLAAKAGVHRNTIARIEAGEASHGPTLAAVRRALEDAGIIFLSAGEQANGGPGVRLREPEET